MTNDSRRLDKRKKTDWLPLMLLLPSFILLAGITVYPFLSGLYNSFFDYSLKKPTVNFIGFKNYVDILKEGKFMASLGFTILFTVIDLVVAMVLGFITALLLQQKFAGKNLLKAIMLIPWILPQVVTGFIFNLMIAQDMGILNRLMALAGLVPFDFSWFSSPKTAMAAVIMANSWRGFPFIALMVYSKMQAVSKELMEAASLDGANAFQKFLHVVFPEIQQVLMTCAFLVFLWTFNCFDIIKVMTNGGPLEKTTTMSLLLQREAFSYLKIGRACAMAVLMFICLMVIIGLLFLVKNLITKGVASIEERRQSKKISD